MPLSETLQISGLHAVWSQKKWVLIDLNELRLKSIQLFPYYIRIIDSKVVKVIFALNFKKTTFQFCCQKMYINIKKAFCEDFKLLFPLCPAGAICDLSKKKKNFQTYSLHILYKNKKHKVDHVMLCSPFSSY